MTAFDSIGRRGLVVALACAVVAAGFSAWSIASPPASGEHGEFGGPVSFTLPAVRPAQSSLPAITRTFDVFNDSAFNGYVSLNATWFPQAVAYDPTNGTAWVAGGNVGTTGVDVVDLATDLGVRVLPSGETTGIAFDNRTDTMWVTNGLDATTVSVYNATTYALVATVPVGSDPYPVAYDWQTDTMFVGNFGSANVSVVGGSNYTDYASVAAGDGPTALAFDPGNHQIYVSDEESDEVATFPATAPYTVTDIELIQGCCAPEHLIADPANGVVYVADLAPGVGIINTTNETDYATITLPAGGTQGFDGLALDPTNNSLFASTEPLGEIVEYAPAPTTDVPASSITTNLSAGADPFGLAYAPDPDRILVVDNDQSWRGETNLSVIATSDNAVIGSISLDPLPLGTAYSSSHHALYVYDGQDGELLALNETTFAVEDSAFVGYTGLGVQSLSGYVAYDPANDAIYVDFEHYLIGPGGVAIVNASTFAVTYLPASDFSIPSGLAYDPTDNRVFVADYLSGQVGELAGGSTAAPVNITVGPNPVGVAFDSANDGVYVANEGNESVTIVHAADDAVVHWATVSEEPYGVVADPDNGQVYVADSDADALTVVNASTNTSDGRVYIGGTVQPYLLSYDPVNQTLLVTEPAPNLGVAGTALVFVNTTNDSVMGNLAFGESLEDVSWDGDLGAGIVSGTLPGAVYQVGGAVQHPSPLRVSLAAVPSSVPVNGTTHLVTTVSGGTGPFVYAYSTLPPGCTSANTANLTCTPNQAGSYVVGVNVTPSRGPTGSATTDLLVTPPATSLEVTLSATPDAIRLGGTSVIAANVTGGTQPYSYAYSTLPGGCTGGDVARFTCQPSAAGSFVLGVNVTDAIGATVAATASLSVASGPGPLSATLSATPDHIGLGNSTTFQVVVTGTIVGMATYRYSSLPSGCAGPDAAQFTCTPTAAGTFQPSVEVNTTAGQFANASTSLTVVSSSPAPSGSSSGSLLSWWWLIVIILLAVVIFFLLLWRRRRRDEDAPPPGGPAAPPTGGGPAGGPPSG